MRVLDVYSIPGRWYYVKFALVTVVLSVRKFILQFSSKKGLKPGYGVQSNESLEDMDKKQPLSKDPKGFDAVYINGANRIGWYLIAGLARRPINVDGFLMLKVPGVGLLLSPKLPDTVLQEDEEDCQSFSSEGLSLTPIKAMKTWRLQYKGKMRLANNPKKKVRVTLVATWQSSMKIFNYDTDMPIKNVAKAMSSEVWTQNFFRYLKYHHQTHYEQFGDLTGNAIIDDVDFNINISAMRDHSFGVRREWKAFHRYVLHFFTLADGTRGTVGVVCLPNLFSRLEIGYVYGSKGSLDAAGDMDFELYQHGEEGVPPTDYGFTFVAGSKYYEVKVHVEESSVLYLGLEWEARIEEHLCRYTVNDVEGWGVVEWMFSHSGGRPHSNG